MKIPSGVDLTNPAKSYCRVTATTDGWYLERSDDVSRIVASSGSRFMNDDEAADHVMRVAWEGSPLHEAALIIVSRSNPEDKRASAYVAATLEYLRRREEQKVMRSDVSHLHMLKALMQGACADRMRSSWRQLESRITRQISSLPSTGVSAPLREKAALSAAKDLYLLTVTSGSYPEEAARRVVADTDIFLFMESAGLSVIDDEPEEMLLSA